jgi:hypothetical protein
MWTIQYEYRILNKEPQNYEGITSTFNIPCSIFCGFIGGAEGDHGSLFTPPRLAKNTLSTGLIRPEIEQPLKLSPPQADGSLRTDFHTTVASDAFLIIIDRNEALTVRLFNSPSRTNRLAIIA